MKQESASEFLLIERERRKMKLDKDIKSKGFTTHRERMDIADFDVVKWCEQKSHKVVGIAKHLCGGATDLTLTSFEHLSCAEIPSKLRGLSIATCCHHACDIKTYVNLPLIKEILPELCVEGGQICDEGFTRFARCSGWAV
jgi:tRNA:m4X modification enzyme